MKDFPIEGSGEITCAQEMEVRWGDCDAAGIVYYAKYFDWFTDGRIALLKQIGLPYQKFFHEQGIVVVVIEASCRYRKNLRSEEKYMLSTTFTKLGRTRMVYDYLITKPEDQSVVAEGRTVHAYIDETGKPFDIKKRRPDLWEKLLEQTGQ